MPEKKKSLLPATQFYCQDFSLVSSYIHQSPSPAEYMLVTILGRQKQNHNMLESEQAKQGQNIKI